MKLFLLAFRFRTFSLFYVKSDSCEFEGTEMPSGGTFVWNDQPLQCS